MEFVRNPRTGELVKVGSSQYKGLVKDGIVFERPKVPQLVVKKGNELHVALPKHIVNGIKELVLGSNVEYGGQLDFDYGGFLESLTLIRGSKTNVSLVDMGDFEVLWHIHQKALNVDGDNPPSLADMRALIAMQKQCSLIFTPNAIYKQYLVVSKKEAMERWNMLMRYLMTLHPTDPVKGSELYVVKHLRRDYPEISIASVYKPKYRQGRLKVFEMAVGVATEIIGYEDDIKFVLDIYEPKK